MKKNQMTKSKLYWKELMEESKAEYKAIISKIPFPSLMKLPLFLVKLGLGFLTIILVIEFFKYPDLDYVKIQTYILLIISSKLSWIILQNE